ncbi:hypothetical protein [Rhodanobacter glycinis]|uniref:hypothetical protein n=1 Tax=Rhodanobacter glycinis TaxID=582702 RepID=UPI0011268A8D|nr:hypothetical protein [Rhodanobacter glycinis]
MHIHSMIAFRLIALSPFAAASAEPKDLVASFVQSENRKRPAPIAHRVQPQALQAIHLINHPS